MSSHTPTTKKPKSAPKASLPRSKQKPKPALKKLHKSEERVVDSSDEDDEDESTLVEEVTTSSSSSGGDSSTEKGSESEEEEEEEEEQPMAKDSDVTAYKYTYAPPPTFKLITPSSSSSSNPFSSRNLEGKELWFITAPIAAPLSKLNVVNPADIAEGVPVLQTGSRSYCLRAQDETEELTGVSLAVQDGGKGAYRIASKRIAKSFQMVEQLPATAGLLAETVSRSKPVREQPEGLWMRFKPIGYVGAQGEDANVEMVDVEVRPERDDGEHRRKKRRSHKEGEDGSREKKEKKEKKHRSKEKHRSREAVEV